MCTVSSLERPLRLLVVAFDARKEQRRILGRVQLERGRRFLVVAQLNHRVLAPVQLREGTLGRAHDAQLQVQRLLAKLRLDFLLAAGPLTLHVRPLALDGDDELVVAEARNGDFFTG